MSVKYRVIARRTPGKPEEEKLFYAQVVTKGEVSMRELATEIASISTVSIVDTLAVIEAFIQSLPRHLTKGEIIRLGDFGSYAIGLLSKGAVSQEEFSPRLIKGVKIYFRPGRELKKALSTVEFEKEQSGADKNA
jgi:predicted histone-like DNA-binding protein